MLKGLFKGIIEAVANYLIDTYLGSLVKSIFGERAYEIIYYVFMFSSGIIFLIVIALLAIEVIWMLVSYVLEDVKNNKIPKKSILWGVYSTIFLSIILVGNFIL